MANRYEITIRTNLDAAGVRAGERQANQYFDNIVKRAQKTSAEVEKAFGRAFGPSTWDRIVRDAERAGQRINKALTIKPTIGNVVSTTQVSRQVEQQTRAASTARDKFLRDQLRAIEQSNRAEVAEERRRAAAAQRASRDKEREQKRAAAEVDRINKQTARNAEEQERIRARASKVLADEKIKNIRREQDEYLRSEAAKRRADQESKRAHQQLISDRRAVAQGLQQGGREVSAVGIAATAAITVPVVLATKEAIDFESAFAGVRKTVDASEAEFAALRSQFRGLSQDIPVSVQEFSRLGEAAGQLGVKNKDILEFTKTMAALGVTTNLASEEGAESIARFANIIANEVGPQYDRIGSTIVDLGNKSAATEKDIVSMALRIAGAGKQIGLSEPQILSIATALSSVGIEAEAGGSAISRTFVDIALAVNKGGPALERFADVSGVTAEEFKKQWQEDAALAVLKFIEGLGKMQKAGKDTFGILEELGLNEIRQRDALLRAAGAGELFRKTLEVGNKAWQENNALTKEAAQRYATSASQLDIFKNRVLDLAISIGDKFVVALVLVLAPLSAIIGALAKFAEAHPAITSVVAVFLGFGAVLGPLLVVVGALAVAVGTLINTYLTLSVAVAKASANMAAFTAAAQAAGIAAVKLTLILGALALVIGLVAYWWNSYESATDKANKVTAQSVEVATSAYSALQKLSESAKEVANSQAGSAERHEKLNAILGQLDPTTQAYIRALKGEETQVKALNTELERQLELKRSSIEATLRVTAAGILEQQQQLKALELSRERADFEINLANAQIAAGRDVTYDPVTDRFTNQREIVLKYSQALNEIDDKLKTLREEISANEAKFIQLALSLNLNREQLTLLARSFASSEEEVNALLEIYDRLNPKVKENTAETDKNTQAVNKQLQALNDLKRIQDSFTQRKTRIDAATIDIVETSKDAAEARRRVLERRKENEDLDKDIKDYQRIEANKRAVDAVISPSKSGGGGRATPFESLESQAKKLRFEIAALQRQGAQGFKLRYEVEGLTRLKEDIQNLLKLRYELGLPLTLPIPEGNEAIQASLRQLERLKTARNTVLESIEAQQAAEVELATLIAQRSIPLISAEVQGQLNYEKALRDRREAENALNADLKTAILLRTQALKDEQSTLRETFNEYSRLRLDAVNEAEEARRRLLRARLSLAVETGGELKIQEQLEVQLRQQTTQPIVTISEGVQEIIKIISRMESKSGTKVAPAAFSVATAQSTIRDYLRSVGQEGAIRAVGQGRVHNRYGLDHRNALDVALNPSSPQGVAFRQFLEAQGIPFSAFVAGTKTSIPGLTLPAHFHVGALSQRTGKVYRVGTTLVDQSGRKVGTTTQTPTSLEQLGPPPPVPRLIGAPVDIDRATVQTSGARSTAGDDRAQTRLATALANRAGEVENLTKSIRDLEAAERVESLTSGKSLDQIQAIIRAEEERGTKEQDLTRFKDKTIEQLQVEEAILLDKEAARKAERATAVDFAVTEHNIALARARDAQYVARIEKDAQAERARQHRSTLDQIIRDEAYLKALQTNDPEVAAQLAARFQSQRVSEAISRAEQIKQLENDIANASEGAAERYHLAWLQAIRNVQLEDERAATSIIESQVRIADSTIYHSQRANARVLEFLASQKGITDLAADFKLGLLQQGFDSVDASIQKLIGTGNKFKSLLADLIAGLLKLSISRAIAPTFGGGGGAALGGGGGGGGLLGGLLNLGSSIFAPRAGGVPFATGGFAGGPGAGAFLGGTATGGLNLINAVQNPFTNFLRTGSFQSVAGPSGGAFGVAGSPFGSVLGAGNNQAQLRQVLQQTGGVASTGLGALLKGGAGSLLQTLGPLAPLLGVGAGLSLGQGSTGGSILGAIGGGLAGLGILGGLSAATLGGIGGSFGASIATGLGGIFGTTSGLGGAFAGLFGGTGSLASFAAIAGPVALIAAPLLVGAYLLSRNSQRRKEEQIRTDVINNSFAALDVLLKQAQSGQIDVATAEASFKQIRAAYIEQVSQLKDKKTRNIALKDVSRLDVRWQAIKAAAEKSQFAREFESKFFPTFHSGGIITERRLGRMPGIFTGADTVTVRRAEGETILNPVLVNRLGGPQAMAAAGVPGYSNSGVTTTTASPVGNTPNGATANAQGQTVVIVVFSEEQAAELAKLFPHAVIANKLDENIFITGPGGVVSSIARNLPKK